MEQTDFNPQGEEYRGKWTLITARKVQIKLANCK